MRTSTGRFVLRTASKGLRGWWGSAAIAEFTHGIEAVLDRIRGGTLVVDSDIITTLLEARDHLAMMVESEAVKTPIPPSGELTQRLSLLLRGPGAAPGGPGAAHAALRGSRRASSPPRIRGTGWSCGKPEPGRGQRVGGSGHAGEGAGKSEPADNGAGAAGQAPASKPSATGASKSKKKLAAAESAERAAEPDHVPAEGESTVYEITLMPGPDVLRRGVNPLGVLDELRELGETTITTDPDLVPPLEQLDPERCYLTWTIHVKTDGVTGPTRRGISVFCRG